MPEREGVSVEQAATLHETTVKGAQELAGAFSRAKPRARSSRSSSCRLEQVHPLAMAAARELQAKRPGTRLRVVDASTVVVE